MGRHSRRRQRLSDRAIALVGLALAAYGVLVGTGQLVVGALALPGSSGVPIVTASQSKAPESSRTQHVRYIPFVPAPTNTVHVIHGAGDSGGSSGPW
jgi:hypothetical protein